MGYYSDVALLLDKESGEALRTALLDAPIGVRKLLEGLEPQVDDKTGMTLYHWEQVKWQDEVAEFVDAFIATLDDDQYRFIRLGERFGDLDDYGGIYDSPFGLEVVAKIEFAKTQRKRASRALPTTC